MKTFTTQKKYEASYCHAELVGEIVEIGEPNELCRYLLVIRDNDSCVFHAAFYLDKTDQRFAIGDMVLVKGGARIESGDDWIELRRNKGSRTMVDVEELYLEILNPDKVELSGLSSLSNEA